MAVLDRIGPVTAIDPIGVDAIDIGGLNTIRRLAVDLRGLPGDSPHALRLSISYKF